MDNVTYILMLEEEQGNLEQARRKVNTDWQLESILDRTERTTNELHECLADLTENEKKELTYRRNQKEAMKEIKKTFDIGD